MGEGFHYVDLYDEQIDSNVVRTPRGLVLIHNTYLSSFAYNLFLCHLFVYQQSKIPGGQPSSHQALHTRLLRHNFKKYFAEQLYSKRNNIFARAVFLETLLFEQVGMVPVFAAVHSDAALNQRAQSAANLISSLVSFHELGHYYFKEGKTIWDEVLSQHPHTVAPLFENVTEHYSPLFAEEFKCDTLALLSGLEQYTPEWGDIGCLRAIAFAYATFAVLSSLTKSAHQTVAQQRNLSDEVDFRSIEKKHSDYDYTIGIDIDFAVRARLMLRLCEQFAAERGFVLFGSGEPFPLDISVVDDLLLYVEGILDNDDANARAMSLLVAEALHDHPRGTEYLYIRSKTFESQRVLSHI